MKSLLNFFLILWGIIYPLISWANTVIESTKTDARLNAHSSIEISARHGIACKVFTNNSWNSYFIPLATWWEYNSFINSISWLNITMSDCITYSWDNPSWWSCSASPSWWAWSTCTNGSQSRLCQNTNGTQSRSASCIRSSDGAVVSDTHCTETKPSTSQSCSSTCSGSNTQSCTVQPINCPAWSINSWIYSWVNYSYASINHGNTRGVNTSQTIPNGTRNYSGTANCNNGSVTLTNQTTSVSCNSWYSWNGSSCVANQVITYSYSYWSWSSCSANPSWWAWWTCSNGNQTRTCQNTNGTQSRSASCIRSSDGAVVVNSLCDPVTYTVQSCTSSCSGSNTQTCVSVGPANCTWPDGTLIAHGWSKLYFLSNAIFGCFGVWNTQLRECNNGVLSGNFIYPTCTTLPWASCTWPDGTIIPHGTGKTYYESSTCAIIDPFWYSQQWRTCHNGVLNGSFVHPSCSINFCILCN